MTTELPTKFAMLLHDLSEQSVQALCNRYKVPSEYRDLALLVVRYQQAYLRVDEPSTILDLLLATDAFRRPERFKQFLAACKFAVGHPGRAQLLEGCLVAAANIDTKKLTDAGLSGNEMAIQVKQLRLQAIKNYMSQK